MHQSQSKAASKGKSIEYRVYRKCGRFVAGLRAPLQRRCRSERAIRADAAVDRTRPSRGSCVSRDCRDSLPIWLWLNAASYRSPRASIHPTTPKSSSAEYWQVSTISCSRARHCCHLSLSPAKICYMLYNSFFFIYVQRSINTRMHYWRFRGICFVYRRSHVSALLNDYVVKKCLDWNFDFLLCLKTNCNKKNTSVLFTFLRVERRDVSRFWAGASGVRVPGRGGSLGKGGGLDGSGSSGVHRPRPSRLYSKSLANHAATNTCVHRQLR